MKITKEQVKELSEIYGNDNCTRLRSDLTTQLKEWFPKAFETKLEVGKWYKANIENNKFLYLFTDLEIKNDRYVNGYGFNYKGKFGMSSENDLGICKVYEASNLIPATDKEVEAALVVEATRRGFKEGVTYRNIINSAQCDAKGHFVYDSKNNQLCFSNSISVVFQSGDWAEILTTMSKEEAEEKLGVKII